jgi:hypothetical protein
MVACPRSLPSSSLDSSSFSSFSVPDMDSASLSGTRTFALDWMSAPHSVRRFAMANVPAAGQTTLFTTFAVTVLFATLVQCLLCGVTLAAVVMCVWSNPARGSRRLQTSAAAAQALGDAGEAPTALC